ncbi:substrate-binding domain-containing protein [Sinanaerobacter chloroacetimidivorans]|uniref:Substrate-binding domain-containing protein n=1 Tax=Sinanaerobacter chloroacetimidivorans TaxID=2818044 RepID=A0A8J7W057_9FIRM|nr:substrate-binding domain-containing protein [Sinanaerobacter chloroacetimidivorans]MBR0597921.1 substrate-binding domain-containing protein [Sinanaerobacter chloroacetimidivorans]
MKNQKKLLVLALALIMVLTMFAGCSSQKPADEPEQEGPAEIIGKIILATTTSTQDSGLLDEILPDFTYKTGYEVDVVAVGSGEAMKMGENGEADVLLVHSPAAEKAFVEAGHGPERFDVMYNDFIILGPKDDPAGIKAAAPDNAQAAFQKIYDDQVTFVSRADESGTHKKELSIWEKLGLTPSGDWYVESGKGMGDVITMTNEMLGYTLSDRATWLNMSEGTDLQIITEGDKDLYNQYGVIVVNPEKNEMINAEGALAFQNWILSDETQALIGQYGTEKYGQPLFTPNASK